MSNQFTKTTGKNLNFINYLTSKFKLEEDVLD